MRLPRTLIALLFSWTACAHVGDTPLRVTEDIPGAGQGFELALFQSTGVKFHEHNNVRLIYNGGVFVELERAIAAATHSVNVVLYIWRPGDPSDRIIAALEKKTREGVACRVMVDPVGSTPAFQKEVRPRLLAAHCDVREFRPVKGGKLTGQALSRNHRKIFVLDGQVAFTGGFGMYSDWLGNGLSEHEWRDTAVRIEGPVVQDLQVSFAENWQEAGGPLLPAVDFPPPTEPGSIPAAFVASSVQVGPSNADRLTQLTFASAKKRLWVSNAYFVPPDGVMDLLEAKRKEGVDVRILTTGPIHDVPAIRPAARECYERLLKAGVRIWEYQPAMMHAKTIIVDDRFIVVGSMNLDPLSLNRLEEGSLLAEDAALNTNLAEHYLQDLAHGKEMNLNSEELPGFWGKLSQSLFRWVGQGPGR